MSTSTQAVTHRRIYEVSPTRKIVMGIIELLISLLIFLVFVRTVAPDVVTTFVMTPGGIDIGTIGDWILPSRLTLIILGVLCLLISVFQLVKGFGLFFS